MTDQEVVEYYNQRGSSEKIFDEMNNDFWLEKPTVLIPSRKHCLSADNGNVPKFLSVYIGEALEKSAFCRKRIQTQKVHLPFYCSSL